VGGERVGLPRTLGGPDLGAWRRWSCLGAAPLALVTPPLGRPRGGVRVRACAAPKWKFAPRLLAVVQAQHQVQARRRAAAGAVNVWRFVSGAQAVAGGGR
jgi:hypothetical protein